MSTDSTFQTDFDISWYRSRIDRETMRELQERSNWRGWLQTLSHLGLYFATGTLCFFIFLQIDTTNWYWTVPLLLATLFWHGTIGPFMGLIAVHELQHYTVFKSRAINEFFEKFYSFLSWSDWIWYRASHTVHHQATCHRAYDGEVVLPLRFSLSRWQIWLGLLAWNPRNTWGRIKLLVRHARGDIRGEWYQHVLPEANEELRRKHRNWARFLLIGHSVIALAFILSGNWFLVFLFTIGTQYCGWLGFLCGLPQHYGLNPNIPDFRQNTRTFTASWVVGFYYWNMQYHLEHHMYPAVPFYNLPKLRAAIEHDLPPAPHGLRATWRHMLSLRRKMISEPSFVFDPFEGAITPAVAS